MWYELSGILTSILLKKIIIYYVIDTIGISIVCIISPLLFISMPSTDEME